MVASVSTVPAKRLPRAVREQQMLDAAVAVFSRRGYHAAAMDEIAEVAGISKPMVYAYLGTKEDLFLACLHREATRLAQAVLDVVTPAASPDEQLWRGLRAFFRFVAAHRDGWAVLYRQARAQEPFAAELAAMRGRMVEVVRGLLVRGATAGSAPRPVSPGLTSAARREGGTSKAVEPARAERVPAGSEPARAERVPAGSEPARAERAPAGPDMTPIAYALIGAVESLGDWAVDRPDEDPDAMATRLMNLTWLGFSQLLSGATWSPPA
jgi:AcrR family transcriptional regulator